MTPRTEPARSGDRSAEAAGQRPAGPAGKPRPVSGEPVRSRPLRTRLRFRTRVLLLLVLIVPNLFGTAVVVTLALWILPLRGLSHQPHLLLVNMLVLAGFLLLAVPTGVALGHRAVRTPRVADVAEGRERLRRVVLRAPLRLAVVQGLLWSCAVVIFFVVNVIAAWQLGMQVGATVLLGGLATVSISYRLVERVLRPEVEHVFAQSAVPRRRGIPGVVLRTLGSWLFGTAVPLLGVMFAAVAALAFDNYDLTRLAVVVLVLCGVALLVGGTAIALTAASTSAPITAVRRGLRRIERGSFDVTVPIFDTTELGQLQAGFNSMVTGLRERERMRDLFGRHVGEDVARHALDNELDLRGEVREVAVLFVDLIGSTRLAASWEPTEVVDLLNECFSVVIDAVEREGGWINKFEGDAALAVFGAPSDLQDPSGCALRAARVLAGRLEEVFARRADPDLGAGIGVSAGPAVAGNIGDPRRYEYTVIGDPVNEAARLCDVAKDLRGTAVGVAAAGPALHRCRAEERANWRLEGHKLLRGRSEDTAVHVPAEAPGPGS